MSLPTYLCKKFFNEVLDPENTKNILIEDLKISRTTTGGNYCSDIYRVKIKYLQESGDDEEKILHLLVKDLFELLSDNSCEYLMYTKILPTMNQLLTEAGIQRSLLSPKLFLARKFRNEVHVLDDMNQHGYTVGNRLSGLNFAQSQKIIEKLAYFHASSMIFQKKPEIVAQLNKFFWLESSQLDAFIKNVIDGNTLYIADIVSQWKGYERIATKMLQKNMGKEFRYKFLSIFEPNATKLGVIVHSDLWIKNILLLESQDNAVLDAVFIDYQCCYVGSPAIDINNYFMTSVELNVLRTDYDNLIEHYHHVLIETLRKCNAVEWDIELPTLDELHADILRTEYFTYYDLIFAFPQTNLSEELASDMDYSGLFDTEKMTKNRENMFNNPRVLETLKFMLKRLDNLSILD